MNPSGPLISTRSVSDVPSTAGSTMWSKVMRTPGARLSSTHSAGRSTRVTVNVLRGKPLALLVITAPGRSSPSMLADSMWSAASHDATSVQANQTASGSPRDTVDASYDGTSQR